MDRVMERQLDAPAAQLLKSLVARKGIKILLDANTARIHGESHVEGVELADGRRIEAEAVIFAAGAPPKFRAGKGRRDSSNSPIVGVGYTGNGVPGCFSYRRSSGRPRTLFWLV